VGLSFGASFATPLIALERRRTAGLAGAADKRLALTDGGHAMPRSDLLREATVWLDRYLGPVR
jgi:hypothetical protein